MVEHCDVLAARFQLAWWLVVPSSLEATMSCEWTRATPGTCCLQKQPSCSRSNLGCRSCRSCRIKPCLPCLPHRAQQFGHCKHCHSQTPDQPLLYLSSLDLKHSVCSLPSWMPHQPSSSFLHSYRGPPDSCCYPCKARCCLSAGSSELVTNCYLTDMACKEGDPLDQLTIQIGCRRNKSAAGFTRDRIY